ncbi:MAG: PDZ domain-containing protein [Gemmatimonadales bacterium]
MRQQVYVGALLTAGALALAPGGLAAQEDERPLEYEPLEMRLEQGPNRLMRIVMNRRARLGITVNLRARETDSIGAYVDAVTPSGPAAKAGIRSGDVITKLDGQSVLEGGVAEREDHRQSLPGLRLIELAARLAPNDTVPVELRRGAERRTVSLVTEDEPDFALHGMAEGRPFGFRFGPGAPIPVEPLPAGDFLERFDAPAPHLEFLSGSLLADLELARLNSELGQYFGTSEGVLVIRAPKDSRLGLKGGDVVLAVDGRKPVGPSHLLRILRSYDRGETFKLDILRNRKRETVSASLAERKS